MLAEPLKSLGKKGKNAQNRKELIDKEKGKEIQKARKTRLGTVPAVPVSGSGLRCRLGS